MQEKKTRRSNKQRSDRTRRALLDAARTLFREKGYAETGTPEIVAAAAITRGALYHHFADKADLFRAVVEHEAATVAEQIDRDSKRAASAFDALLDGAGAYFAAMAEPGRARLLLIDGPSVLGPREMRDIDRQTGGRSLKLGLAAITGLQEDSPELDALTELLSAAFDRAALAMAEGDSALAYETAIRRLLLGISKAAP